MRRLILPAFLSASALLMTTSCRMAPQQQLGDTVAARYFYPPDTAAINARHRAAQADSAARMAAMVDSADLFVIAEGSDKHHLVLLSHPSHRDTLQRPRAAHMQVEGRADVGAVARIRWYVTPSGDSLVSRVTVVSPL